MAAKPKEVQDPSTRACHAAMMAYARWRAKQDPEELRKWKEEEAKKFTHEKVKVSDTEYIFILHRADGTSRTSRFRIE